MDKKSSELVMYFISVLIILTFAILIVNNSINETYIDNLEVKIVEKNESISRFEDKIRAMEEKDLIKSERLKQIEMHNEGMYYQEMEENKNGQ